MSRVRGHLQALLAAVKVSFAVPGTPARTTHTLSVISLCQPNFDILV